LLSLSDPDPDAEQLTRVGFAITRAASENFDRVPWDVLTACPHAHRLDRLAPTIRRSITLFSGVYSLGHRVQAQAQHPYSRVWQTVSSHIDGQIEQFRLDHSLFSSHNTAWFACSTRISFRTTD